MDTSAMSLNSTEDIPLADDDLEVIINDDESSKYMQNGRSLDSIASSYTNGNTSPRHFLEAECPDADEQEERARLITQVLELQNTLDDLSQRVDSVKEENLKLRSENQVLGQYIENLMSASSVFQSTNQGQSSSAPKKK
ncbi:short coiled-coil protein B [Malaya genurostris]|uniref:short coiled-coil protein B n=1 Tax=Malaya genurostris TaxID=325434 RepID=UPI0026F39558|nr:short coiled-coil protein B [Malaya genurostris]